MNAHITSVIDNGDGTYDVHFDETPTVTAPATFDHNVLLYDAGTQQWVGCVSPAAAVGNVITFTRGGGAPGSILLAIADTPVTFTTPDPIAGIATVHPVT